LNNDIASKVYLLKLADDIKVYRNVRLGGDKHYLQDNLKK